MTLVNIPSSLLSAIDKIDKSRLGETTTEQDSAIALISKWVKTIWETMIFISDKINHNPNEKSRFYSDFEEKLAEFISHVDHGIVHSYFVYKGMLYIDKKEKQELFPDSIKDKQAQLMALVHDSMQVLPFNLENEKFRLTYKNPKNNHADIIADIIQECGQLFGLSDEFLKPFVFGIRVHDSSYKNEYYPEKLNYISKLLHDSDKIFGASIKTDISALTESMLKRNYEANRGPKGSYLHRSELDLDYANKIEYGDRCLSTSVFLIRREFTINMYTHVGKLIAEQRRALAIDQVKSVYGYFFDLTYDYINNFIIPHIQTSMPELKITIAGMDQEEKPLETKLTSKSELATLIDDLYKTPIKLNIDDEDIEKFCQRYNLSTDPRGLKLHIHNVEKNDDVYIDPSIARFCFVPNGRETFLNEITAIFQDTTQT